MEDENYLKPQPNKQEFTTPKKNTLEPSEIEKQKHDRPTAIKITKKKSTMVEIILPG